MAKIVFGMNQSLDGYVDHQEFAPGPALFQHFIEQARGQTGSVYGRRLYEVMRYWDEDHPEWTPEDRDFAAAWRGQPPRRAGSRQDLFRRPPAAAPPCGERSNWQGRDQADLRSCLIGRMARLLAKATS